jgi:hypothetical protein
MMIPERRLGKTNVDVTIIGLDGMAVVTSRSYKTFSLAGQNQKEGNVWK